MARPTRTTNQAHQPTLATEAGLVCPICGGGVTLMHTPERAICLDCRKVWEYVQKWAYCGGKKREEVWASDGGQVYLLGIVSARRR